VLWVQAPNLGVSSGMPADFPAMFGSRDQAWRESRDYTTVWMLRTTSLIGENATLDDDFLPRLRGWGMQLALNVTGATLAVCRVVDRLAAEIACVERIHALGGTVSYLSLQSALSKVGGETCAAYGRKSGFDARIADIVRYAAAMTARFPDIEIGLIDAMPAKGWEYESVYRRLVAALENEGTRLSFLHLDFPVESVASDWSDLRQAGAFIRNELDIPYGLFYVSRTGGARSNVAFRDNVLAAYQGYRAAGGRPDHLVLTSWYPFPDTMLPEDDQAGAPFMNLVRNFARLGGVRERPVGNIGREIQDQVLRA
jgi:hypothetical protein